MPEIARLVGGSDCFELDFLEREATPEPAMKLSIRLRLARLSILDTVSFSICWVSTAVAQPSTIK
jgi:hypothetical protein